MIDRCAVVGRHRVVLSAPDPQHVLSVGNGDFACTVDITGMQSFTAFHDPVRAMRSGSIAVNTATMSNWGWHEMPNPDHFVLEDAMTSYASPRGPVLYPDKYDMEAAMRGEITEENRAGAWLHNNPQRLDLGRIGLELRPSTTGVAETDPSVLQDVHQELDLWTGLIESRFSYAGGRVKVETVAAPETSCIAFRICSPLLADQRLRVRLRFPYASEGFFQTSNWDAPERHGSTLAVTDGNAFSIERCLDGTKYFVHLTITDGTVAAAEVPHEFIVTAHTDVIEIVARFSPDEQDMLLGGFGVVKNASAEGWKRFWLSGAAIDMAGAADPRAFELEHRVILSQYLTAVHCAGTLPPQETGLFTNSWQGKFHLEMHFWHGAHFAAWGRPELLEKSLRWYHSILPVARDTAARQGYRGARWPKHVGPDGRESPSPIGALLIWQQPHILYLLELAWRASAESRRAALVQEYADIVEETAVFMADFADDVDGVLHLGPPVMPAQEFYDAHTTRDPTFELAYWWWGLEVAQRWQERLGLGRSTVWDDVQARLAKPRQHGACYAAIDSDAALRRDDHPSLVAALGVVPPTPIIDASVMEATLMDVLQQWSWPSAWGWDFPMLAMTATRLGKIDLALDALLRDETKNRYSIVGHTAQIKSVLPIYLPSNGALLAALSLMISCDDRVSAANLTKYWNIRAEGFVSWP